MEKMNDFMMRSQFVAKERYDAAMVKAMEVRDQALIKMNISPQDVEKLNMIPFIGSIVGLFVNILLLAAISNFAWIEGTAMADGQPFQVHSSLGSAIFGPPAQPNRDNVWFCEGGGSCSLRDLCAKETPSEKFDNGMPKYTDPSDWCKAANAGSIVGGLLGFGFIPAIAATAFTFMYASKEVSQIAAIFDKVQQMGLPTATFKYVVVGCWGLLWLFMFLAMATFSILVPDTLGWGTVNLEASFGLLRFSFFVISIFGAILVSHLFELWATENVAEAYAEFATTKFFSWKKALYLELIAQIVLYLFLTIYMVDWSLLLVGIAGYYLDAKKTNFKLVYLVFISISIVLDFFRFAALPSVELMTPGASFGNSVWMCIFVLKGMTVATIYFYEKEELDDPAGFAKMEEAGGSMGENDEIAE